MTPHPQAQAPQPPQAFQGRLPAGSPVRRAFSACKHLAMAALFLGLAASAQAVVKIQTFTLFAQSNDYMSSIDHANANLAVVSGGAWMTLNVYTNWMPSGPAGGASNPLPDGYEAFFFKRIQNFYKPDSVSTSWAAINPSLSHSYIPYSNILTVAVTSKTSNVSLPWNFTSYPDEFTNATAFRTSFTNAATLSWIPTGTYAVSFASVRGYIEPAPTNIIVGASRLEFSTNACLPYSNDLAVTVAGIPGVTNAIWTLAGPAAFSNAVSFGAQFTSSFTVAAIPTGIYTVTFPTVAGFTTPAPVATNIVMQSPALINLTGLYVAVTWPSTNTPTPAPTNFPAYTNAVTVMADTNGNFIAPSAAKIIAANGLVTTNMMNTNGIPGPPGPTGSNGLDGAPGLAASIMIAWTSNGPPGSAALVTNTGSSNVAAFGFVIPAGSNGASASGAMTNLANQYAATGSATFVDGTLTIVHGTNAGGEPTNLSGYVATNDPAYTDTVARAASALQVESDPDWAAHSNAVTYTNDARLSDARPPLPHSQDWTTVTNHPEVNQAIVDASTATSAIPRITSLETRSNTWNQAATDATTATSTIPRIADIESRTSTWNQAAIDASAATSALPSKLNSSATNGWTVTSHDALLTGASVCESTNASGCTTNSGTLLLNIRTNWLDTPYQAYTVVTPDAGATATVTCAAGSLVKITAAASPITITFDNADYPTNGVNRVAIDLWAGTNSVVFLATSITNAAAPTISTNAWTSLFFRKSNTNTVWTGRQ